MLDLKLIKRLLIVGAVIIVAGFAFMATVVFQRATGSGPLANLGRPASELAVAGPLVAKISLGLAPGERIEAIQSAGNRVVLLIRGASGADRVLVADPVSGAVATLSP